MMDASKTAWGAHCGSQTVQGSWNPHQQALHINLLELMAVWNALKAFLHWVRNQVVLIQMDNTSVLHYINNSGGTRLGLLYKTTWDMLQW
jgi:ribonuclease HI